MREPRKAGSRQVDRKREETLDLPAPALRGPVSLEEALASRRSLRDFSPEPLDLKEISQLLWAVQGITDSSGSRTAPSAGGLCPLEVLLALPGGLFRYQPRGHRLVKILEEDLREAMDRAAFSQGFLREASAVFVLAAARGGMEFRYGEVRAPRYVAMEAGHAAQNLLLQAVSLGLGGVPVGAFDDARIRQTLLLPQDHDVLYLVPVGRPRPR